MRIWPARADLIGLARHPTAGVLVEGFNDWPKDSFTTRRLRDGDITTEESEAATLPPPEEPPPESAPEGETTTTRRRTKSPMSE